MMNTRGWDVAVLVAAVVLSALLVANRVPGAELVGGLVAVAALVAVWFVVGRRGDESPTALTSMVLLIVLGGVATAISPPLATMQAILFPLLWFLSRTTQRAVVGSLLLALSVGIGYVAGLGWSTDFLLEIVVIELISLCGNFAIGFWITRISVESAERRRLLEELGRTQDLLAAASRESGMVSERERLSRELHDTIAQDLTGLVLLTQRVRREVLAGDPMIGETLELLEDSARSTLAETRALVASSAPVALADGGIVAALERLAGRIQRETGIVVTVAVVDGAAGAPPAAAGGAGAGTRDSVAHGSVAGGLGRDEEVVLLRCAQEALANVRRHAGATTASVTLRVDEHAATLEVVDDGRGFDANAERTGFGLDGLADRLTLGGGALRITSAPGRGTLLSASLPRTRVDA
ncbi:sensor histidine kinase [Labedella endophytica]|uniref:histidine kinase n=1 Tax=Labedella endophytica TaxID=1523160 RepID=A0A3S0VHD1_9MICO|nr:sensor histidine kinase [Labedella endophytica]RUR01957.1 sensor histidine kinase [Labedella endophytica]